MSRAFVKEIDDIPDAAERPISDAPNFVTRRGAELIEREITDLESQLPAGALSTGERALRRDLRYWQSRRSTMQITEAAEHPSAVTFGTEVAIKRRGRTITIAIVGEDEADPPQSKIAWTSPLARALLGAQPSEKVPFEAGGAEEEIEVLSIKRLSDS
jgi:transcription elongation GreA/GreB family factor